jgi:hypothetical protein
MFVLACALPQISLNRRLPGTFRRVLGLSARCADEQYPSGTMKKTSRAVVSGSRLFNTVFGLPRPGKEDHEVFRHVLKRLPSRRWEQKTPYQRATAIEDEYDLRSAL